MKILLSAAFNNIHEPIACLTTSNMVGGTGSIFMFSMLNFPCFLSSVGFYCHHLLVQFRVEL
eukprot:snap_masked-scaffold_1-processed-gene-29.2-mRNA-1 protein AED:1.00 eAED:1.00 QI:0/0/0/0/1/1/2/0/61